MSTELYEAYVEICDELGLSVYPVAEFNVAQATLLEGAEILEVGAHASTWLLARDDQRDGCPCCLTSVASFIDYFYDDQADEAFSALSACRLLTAFHSLHDLSIAVSNAYGAQNWSCVVPLADCQSCANNRIGAVPSALRRVEPQCDSTSAATNDTGGDRSISAERFVDRNRWAFGFASVVGNPVAVVESDSVALVNAPIRSTFNPQYCEIAGGKGIDSSQALASCLGEGFERYALASSDRRKVVVGIAKDVQGAVDIAATFGFPVLDHHPSVSDYGPRTVIEWIEARDLITGTTVRLPANFAYCPYRHGEYVAIVGGSTNGAATGGTVDDARLQAIREIVERDAFWFYARTGASPIRIDETLLPPDIAGAIRLAEGIFTVSLLENPYLAPVVNVSVIAGENFSTKTARGSGHAGTLEQSIRRAFAECIQMLYSLDSGIEINPVSTDMRHLWYSGKAVEVMPNLFLPPSGGERGVRKELPVKENQSVLDFISGAQAQGQSAYEIPLIEENTFAVTKVLFSDASVADATYFATNERLTKFASLLGLPEPTVRYHDSLFM